jgi:hypothetical protein
MKTAIKGKASIKKRSRSLRLAAFCGTALLVALYGAVLLLDSSSEEAASAAPEQNAADRLDAGTSARAEYSLYADLETQTTLTDGDRPAAIALPDFQNALSRELADLLPENILLPLRGEGPSALRRLEELEERRRVGRPLAWSEQRELRELRYLKYRDRLQLLEYTRNLYETRLDETGKREFETMIERERSKVELARSQYEEIDQHKLQSESL